MELVKNYAYEGKVVKLTKNNLEQWRKTFKNIVKVDAKVANENKQDESGRKVDSTGNPIFKRMP